jgi:hypothetical protein
VIRSRLSDLTGVIVRNEVLTEIHNNISKQEVNILGGVSHITHVSRTETGLPHARTYSTVEYRRGI